MRDKQVKPFRFQHAAVRHVLGPGGSESPRFAANECPAVESVRQFCRHHQERHDDEPIARLLEDMVRTAEEFLRLRSEISLQFDVLSSIDEDT